MSASDAPPVFSAVLHPHRSLNLRGVRLVVALVALGGTVASIPFIVLGFWPVAGFYGLDVLLLFLAMRASLAEARSSEEVTVTPLEVLLRKNPVKGPSTEWRSNPLWTRLHREEHEEFGVQRLALVSRGQSVGLAAFLSPDEKASFGDALAAALAEARKGVTYNPYSPS
ncbi:DUF2244 domain-containing protein [Alsobacter soli]|uniref:DUF2244 domain-containing protein n=1 Tax=Alsobacter soli TaxID=2109933 RepID=A0A2T1HNX8_9HYPH|nr:DUF2244 domain-containing protein [Alsobacter soli]PSC03321.1 DUF2244 domain-containing protein [Alsobacter soli]